MNKKKNRSCDDPRYVPTPLEISEFKTALERGFKGDEQSSAIHHWSNLQSHGAVGFMPNPWAYELLDSGDCLHLDYGGHNLWHIYIVSETKRPSLRGTIREGVSVASSMGLGSKLENWVTQ